MPETLGLSQAESRNWVGTLSGLPCDGRASTGPWGMDRHDLKVRVEPVLEPRYSVVGDIVSNILTAGTDARHLNAATCVRSVSPISTASNVRMGLETSQTAAGVIAKSRLPRNLW